MNPTKRVARLSRDRSYTRRIGRTTSPRRRRNPILRIGPMSLRGTAREVIPLAGAAGGALIGVSIAGPAGALSASGRRRAPRRRKQPNPRENR